jgi:DNA-binding CsgD family transcriptional regulator
MEQALLFDGLAEASAYHSATGRGYFSLLINVDGRKRQFSKPLDRLPQVIPLLDQSLDTWISQAEFFAPNRRVVNLSRVGLLFSDLDTYNSPNMVGKSPEAQAQALEFYCADNGIPLPSLVVFSGRGLQAKWVLTHAVPRQALPRWTACQRALCAALAGFGADRNALDASRVLRLVDTINTKSGEIARVVAVNASGAELLAHDFDFLCEVLLPIGREELQRRKGERQAERLARFQLIETKREGVRQGLGLNGRVLAWDRLEDLRRLGDLRGGWGEGIRTTAVHWQVNFMALAGAVNPGNIRIEAQQLARKIYGAAYRDFDASSMSTLVSKAKQYAAGEKVEFHGREYPALYTPRNSTLIDLFQITSAEQLQLRTIIDKGEAQRRDTASQQARRRAAGVVDRAAYLAPAQERQAFIVKLKADGLSVTAIAEQLGVSRPTVYAALRGV